jgi:phosphatidate phosphatase APP1
LNTTNIIPVIWQISICHLTNNRTLFRGVILNNAPFKYDTKIGALRNLVKVIKSYFITVYANKDILIKSNSEKINATTDTHGSFQIIAEFKHIGEIKIYTEGQNEPLKQLQSYPTTFHETNSAFDVISDIDDTIIVSYTADLFKRISTIAFKTPHKRKVIEFTQNMFTEFNKLDARIFYVSKSESNLFGMLTAFIEHNKLPKGPLFLTPYLKLYQLVSPKKEINFKIDRIRFLIKNTDNKKYVLFGDDSQRDIEIYTAIAMDFPQRILKIYIRQTKSKVLPKQKRMMENLVLTGVPLNYFMSDDILQVSHELTQLKNTTL